MKTYTFEEFIEEANIIRINIIKRNDFKWGEVRYLDFPILLCDCTYVLGNKKNHILYSYEACHNCFGFGIAPIPNECLGFGTKENKQ